MPRIDSAADLARALSRNALPVCRCYLPNGRREGNYWLAGDVAGSPGCSLYVRLKCPVDAIQPDKGLPQTL